MEKKQNPVSLNSILSILKGFGKKYHKLLQIKKDMYTKHKQEAKYLKCKRFFVTNYAKQILSRIDYVISRLKGY